VEKLYELYKLHPITPGQLKSLNNLDKQVTEILLAAEQHICPQQHTTSWSVAIHHHLILCKYWSTIARGVRNSIDIRRLAATHYQQLPIDLQQTIDQVTNFQYLPTLKKVCYKYLRKATQELKNMIRIHRDLCHQSLTSLQELGKAQGNIPTAKIIRKIIRKELHDHDLAIIKAIKNPKIPSPPSKQEQYQQQSKHINPTFHPLSRSSLNTLEIPIWIEITNQPTILTQPCHGLWCQTQSKWRKGC
jgi:hypothetical protein